MGDTNVQIETTDDFRANFIGHLLNDIKSLETMLIKGMIEDEIIRIGAEQEFCLVNENWRPSKKSIEILKTINDPHFTTELARFNLEINLDPLELKGKCFSDMERILKKLLKKADDAASLYHNRIILTGILPTISKNELELEYMTPSPRYWSLNNAIKALRGNDFNLHITGIEELSLVHDSVLFEACNTSFQMHLQIPPDDFISSYNWAQAISGPLLAVSSNSPLLLGRELWSETRIALFQQSIDTRSSSYALKDQASRVTFGYSWAYDSVTEIFKNDIARHKPILFKNIDTSSLDELEEGKIPKLQALSLYNGSIYRWNRACYGVGNGKPHLRIENRYLPSGPSTIDEMANFAFWVGMMIGRPREFDDMENKMDFRDAKGNFLKAARTGKESVLKWNDDHINARDLVINELLPIAYEGLNKACIDKKDIEHYLAIIEKRTNKETGSQWCIRNYRKLKKNNKKDDAILMLTKGIFNNQNSNLPLHEWPSLDRNIETHEASNLVSHIMSTELFTVYANDLAELATSVMLWKNIHHLPVEDKTGKLCGLLTWTHMQNFQAETETTTNRLVSDIMVKDLITVRPETEIKSAIKLMKRNEIGCLPVVQDRHLVGIITINDVIPYDQG